MAKDEKISEEIQKTMTWWDVKDKFKDKIDELVEQKIHERKQKEEEAEKLKQHIIKYPIGSCIEYLGIKMLVKNNQKSERVFGSMGYEYIKFVIGLCVEWADKNDVIHAKEFREQEFNEIRRVDK